MEQLDEYLKEQAADGVYQDSGSFVVDFSRARKKSRYLLPKPEQWILRLLQGLSRLGAVAVDFRVGRKVLTVSAVLPDEANLDGLSGLFRLSDVHDPRFPLQDAVWGALNKDFQVELFWHGAEQTQGFRIDSESIEPMRLKTTNEGGETLGFRVTPLYQSGLLFKMFGKVDFSAEWAETAARAAMVPFLLKLDGRPFGFQTEGRLTAQVALEGPSIKAPSSLREDVRTPDSARAARDYRFLLETNWKGSRRHPLLHWVVDGIQIGSRRLREWESPLEIDLYLSGDGFATDLTRLNLIESEELGEYRKELESLAVFHLLTMLDAESLPGLVASESKRFAADLLAEVKFSRTARFKKVLVEHRNRLALAREMFKHRMEAWQREKKMHDEIEQVKAQQRTFAEREKARFEAVVGKTVSDPELQERSFDTPKPEMQKVTEFFGEVYLSLTRSGKPEREKLPRVEGRHSKREWLALGRLHRRLLLFS